ncbi:MAG TPA: hypothetical protein VNM22_00290 [Candidatus Limnocylindrales bacterium]|nr:hypothetical protein [Candidatus Limnocylindrales bacterium]
MQGWRVLKSERGVALILITAVFSSLFILIGVSLNRGSSEYFLTTRSYLNDVAFNLAEAGVEKALHELSKSESNYQGETETLLGNGTFSVILKPLDSAGQVEILSTGTVQGARFLKVEKKIRVVVQIEDKDSTRKVMIRARYLVS